MDFTALEVALGAIIFVVINEAAIVWWASALTERVKHIEAQPDKLRECIARLSNDVRALERQLQEANSQQKVEKNRLYNLEQDVSQIRQAISPPFTFRARSRDEGDG